MRKALVVATTVVALGMLGTPATAADDDWGRVTGVVTNAEDARDLPCQPEGSPYGVGVVCFPKRSGSWTLVYDGSCSAHVVLAVTWGWCVRAFEDGDVVRVWAYRGTADAYFEIAWH